MKVSIVNIGNSKGVILPKSIRTLVGLSSDKVDLSVRGNSIVISPISKKPRSTIKASFRRKTKR